MANPTVPWVAISAFQAAGLVPDSESEEYYLRHDQGQAKRLRDSQDGSQWEEGFG
jgi:hypothetical protein